MEQIQEIVIKFLRMLFPASIWNWDYFTSLWHRYANFEGFTIGAIIVGLIYFASDVKDGKKRDIFRVFAVVALINAVDGTYLFIMNIVNSILFSRTSILFENEIQGAFNPLSIMLLVLVISESYKNKPRHTLFFGLSTFGVSILMFGSGYSDNLILIYLFIRVIVIAIICMLCSKIRYAFVSYIVMGGYFIITQAILSYLLHIDSFLGEKSFLTDIFSILSSYKTEYIIICFIIIIFALFEVFILTEGKFEFKNLGLSRAVPAVMIPFAMIAILYGVVFQTDIIDEIKQINVVETVTEPEILYSELIPSRAEASSFLIASSGNTYGPEYTIDNSNDTCWQDGQEGDGVGETLTYYFDSNVFLREIKVVNGRVQTEDKYYENNRLAKAEIYYYLEDEIVNQQTILFEDTYNPTAYSFALEEYVECNRVVLEVIEVFYGTAYQDLCVTDVSFEHVVQIN